MRWRRIGLVSGLLCLLLAAGAWFAAAAHLRRQVRLAREELDRNQVRAALDRLEAAAAAGGWAAPRDDELWFWLGTARWTAGRRRAAAAAFRSVSAHGPRRPAALLRLAEGAMAEGRLRDAETYLVELRTAHPRESRESAAGLELLDRIERFEGRNDELRALLWEQIEAAADPEPTLRTLWQLDRGVAPLESLQLELNRARRAQPGDDRVWLGLARAAMLTGRLDEADGWLRKCEASAAADIAVQRARLDWARTARRPDEVLRVLSRLQPGDLRTAEWWSWRAWLCRQSDDTDGELAALKHWLTCEPGRPVILERLVEVSALKADTRAAAQWRRLKADADRAVLRYDELLGRTPDVATAAEALELAGLAEAAGRWTDAAAWAWLAARIAPSDERASLERDRLRTARPAIPPPALAEVLAGLDGLRSRSADAAPESSVRFEDLAPSSGLSMVFQNGESPQHRNPEALSGGIGLLDYDGDGWLDVFVLQGGTFPPSPAARADGDRLFRNRGDGTFEDATERAGISRLEQGFGHGVSVGDLDNDGDPDLFLTRWNRYAVYRNDASRFVDATTAWGLGGQRGWPTSSALADLDGDGDLDLYVCHYARYDPETTPPCLDQTTNAYICCVPRTLAAEPDHLFRNDGGTFVDVSQQAGIVDPDGRGLGVVAADLDGDGRVDLYIANDMTANFLFHNLGGMHFEERAHLAGVAARADGGYQAGMGVACGDLDGDGLIDLAVSNYYAEGTALYRNLSRGLFTERSAAIGLEAATKYRLGFGIALIDADNDGRLDVLQANGHLYRFLDRPYRMPLQLLSGQGGGTLLDVSARAGPPFHVPRLGRALAAGDLDNDGRLDAVVIDHNAQVVDLRNRTEPAGGWLVVQLQGTSSNRDAVGAVVTVLSERNRWVAHRSGGGSYQSASDPRIHFGLGQEPGPVSVTVHWPSGHVDRHPKLPANAAYRLREGDAQAKPLKGYRRPSP